MSDMLAAAGQKSGLADRVVEVHRIPEKPDWRESPETPEIVINRGYCKKCGICIAVCPADVYAAGPDGSPQVVQPDRCIWCERCEIYCPDFAIQLLGDKAW